MFPNFVSPFLVFATLFSRGRPRDLARIINCPENDTLVITPSEVLFLAPVWLGPQKHFIAKYLWTYSIRMKTPLPPEFGIEFFQPNPKPEDLGKIKIIPEYRMPPSLYEAVIYGTLIDPYEDKLPYMAFDGGPKRCQIRVLPLAPVAVISGGSARHVPPRKDIVFNGSESFDRNSGGRDFHNVLFHWTCEHNRDYMFCNRGTVWTESTFVFPGILALRREIMVVRLNVTLDYLGADSPSHQVTQRVTITEGGVYFEIRCTKNCHPSTDMSDYELVTKLEIVCNSNCEAAKDDDYSWEVKDENDPSYKFDYSNSRFGRTGKKFVVERNTFGPKFYLITARTNVRGIGTLASVRIGFHPPPEVENCQFRPPYGISQLTQFTLSCTQKTMPHLPLLYELYMESIEDSSRELVLRDFYPKYEFRNFTLPPSAGKKFVLEVARMHDDPYPITRIELFANVTSRIENMTREQAANYLMDQYDGGDDGDSVSAMVSDDDPQVRKNGLGKLANVFAELSANTFDDGLGDVVDELKKKVAQDMMKASVDTLEEAVEVSQAMTKIQDTQAANKSDPYLAAVASTVCKKTAERGLELIMEAATQLSLSGTAKTLSGSVAQCVETNSNQNPEAVTPDELDLNTESPTDNGAVVTEDYDNYLEFTDNHYKNINFLEEATFNVINGTATAAKLRAITSPPGEGVIRFFGKRSETLTLTDTGAGLLETRIDSEGVKMVPSKDFENDTHVYNFLMSIWRNDLFWWNPFSVRTVTPIVNIDFFHATCKEKVTTFKRPFEILLDSTNITIVEVKRFRYSGDVPEGFASMADDELNRQIRVYRGVLCKGTMLHVHFRNLDPNGAVNVLVVRDKFPTVEDLAGKVTVTNGSNHTYKVLNENDYSIHVYVGVLPTKETKNLTYEVSSFLTTCMKWLTSKRKWSQICKPGNQSNSTYIHCECNHMSIIAGYVQNITLFRQTVLQADLELVLVSTPVVLITLVLTLVVFLVLLMLHLLHKQNEIYYLGDNNVNHRYAYMVIVRTGLGYKSGTTSSVIIKLTGDKNSSEPHVLNYPDPQARILQQSGNDIFLLTTRHYLGNLTQVELWFDCSGPNPDWYCKEIKVYDLQKNLDWYFDVRKRISITHGTSYLVLHTRTTDRFILNEEAAKSSSKKNKSFLLAFSTKSKLKFKWEPQYHTWYLCQNEENFSYFKKLAVLFSTVVCTYSLALLLLGQPNLHLNCGLDERYKYTLIPRDVLTIFVCSFPTFVLHTAIAWCFRCSYNQFATNEQHGNLPRGCTHICWFVVFTLITSSITFVTAFGFWVPHGKSLVWMTICAISIVLVLLVYETIFVFVVNFYYRMEIKYDVRAHAHRIHQALENQRKYLFLQFGEQLLRPYFEHLYHPLKKKQIHKKSFVVERRHFVVTELHDLMMFAVYIIMLYAVILVNKDSSVLQSKIDMTDIIDGKHTASLKISDVEVTQDIYLYINETLIPSIQPLRWYGNFVISEPGLMVDVVNKYLGIVRLRQHRMTTDLCRVPKLMEFSNTTCYPEFSLASAETKRFGYKWGELSPYLFIDKLINMWKYSGEDETQTLLTVGKCGVKSRDYIVVPGEISAYSGGGYVAYLGRTLYNSYVNFRHMVKMSWIDRATRAIFIEYLTYNANINIFTFVRIYFEQSAAGFISKRVEVSTVRMVLVQNEVATLSLAFFFLFAIWVSFLVLKLSLGVIKHLHTFYKDAWMCIDLIITVFSVLCIVLYLVRMRLVGEYLKAMESNKKNEFHNYFHLYYIEEFLTLAAAFLVCIATVRFWKFLRFATMFRTMERTLTMAAKPLLSFTVALTILLLGSAMTLMLLLGNNNSSFRTMLKTTRSLLTMALKPEELDVLYGVSSKTALFYVMLYIFELVVTKLIFISIIVLAYFNSQLEFSGRKETYNVLDYLKERLQYLAKYLEYRTKRLDAGESTIKNKVEPKSDKFMYVNSFIVLSYKMRFMRYITLSVLRKASRKKSVLSDDDVKVMELILLHFLVKDNSGAVEVFYRGRMRGDRVRFVFEGHVEQVANVVNLMLQEELEFEEEGDRDLVECVRAIRKKMISLQTCELNLKLIFLKLTTAGNAISRL